LPRVEIPVGLPHAGVQLPRKSRLSGASTPTPSPHRHVQLILTNAPALGAGHRRGAPRPRRTEEPRIVRLLVDRVTVGPTGMAVDLRNNGITTLVRDLADSTHLEAAE